MAEENGTPHPRGWSERIESFSTAVARSAEEVTEALATIVGGPTEEALELLASESYVPIEDLRRVLSDGGPRIPVGLLRKHLPLLRGQSPDEGSGPSPSPLGLSTDLLPSVPDDESFLASLKTGGELKIGSVEIISAMKAALADRVGLYDLPQRLLTAMESHAEALREPCGEAFYEMQRLVKQRSYGEVLSVLNLDGHFVSKKRKESLLRRLEENLWSSLHGFHERLMGWQEGWMKGASNPGMIIATLAASVGGGDSPLPQGIIRPPDTGAIYDAAEGVMEDINRVFAGTGIPISRALAWEAMRIKTVLTDGRLPAAVGVDSLEHLLGKLGVHVTADYIRLERNVVRYTLSILELPRIPAGGGEYSYLAAMLQLGTAIPWDSLLTGPRESSRTGEEHKPF